MIGVFDMGDDEVVQLIENNKQVILYGPPGTGKTYNARKIAIELIDKHFSENSEWGITMFTGFEESDFKNFNGTKKYSEIPSTINRLQFF